MANRFRGVSSLDPAAATKLMVNAPDTVTAGKGVSLTVTALDPFNNVATSYQGTAHFTGSDRLASLPRDYLFTATDRGVHVFGNGVILRTAGTQTVTVEDKAAPSIVDSVSIQVGGGGTPAVAIRTATPRGVKRSASHHASLASRAHGFSAAMKLQTRRALGVRNG